MPEDTRPPLPPPEEDEHFALELLDRLFDQKRSPEEIVQMLDDLTPAEREALSRRELRGHITHNSLVGHEEGQNFDLAAVQVAALAQAHYRIDIPVSKVALAVSRRKGAIEDFWAGRLAPPVLDIPHYDFSETITPELLRGLLDRMDAAGGPEDPEARLSVFGMTHAALMLLLHERGLLLGPCPRCRRKEWPAKIRKPGAKGRPPLERDYCPACVIEREWARRAANQRRYRAKAAQKKPRPHEDEKVDSALYARASRPESKKRPKK